MAVLYCRQCLLQDHISKWRGEFCFTHPRSGWYEKLDDSLYYDVVSRTLACDCRSEDVFGFEIDEDNLVALTVDRDGDRMPHRMPLKFHRVDYPHGQQVKINYEIHFLSKEGPAYVFHQERDVSLFHVVIKGAAMLAFKTFRWFVKSARSETRHPWDLQRYECGRMTIAALRCCCFRMTCPEHYEREMKFLVSKMCCSYMYEWLP